jgi:antirestriction factor ArdC-like protein
MAFASAHFLGSIEPTRPTLMRLDRLAVENRGTRRGIASRPLAGQFPQVRMHPFPGPITTKLPKIVLHRGPRPIVARQVAPGAAAAHEIEQAIDAAPQVDRTRPPPGLSGRQEWRQHAPLRIREITGVPWKCHTRDALQHVRETLMSGRVSPGGLFATLAPSRTVSTLEGKVGAFYSYFHDYSFLNRLLFLMQGIREPVASYSRWKQLGRQVIKGSKAKEVIVPVLVTSPEFEGSYTDEETLEEKRERVAKLIGFKVVRAVFPLSMTEGKDLPPVETPGWDLATALEKLGISEVLFNSTDGNLQGWSKGLEFGINLLAANRNKTVFHELGHIILGHTLPHHFEEYQTHRGIMEFQAESVAYLAMHELDLLDEDAASESRGYIQWWLKSEHPPDRAIQQVFTATDRILRAGRIEPSGELPHHIEG